MKRICSPFIVLVAIAFIIIPIIGESSAQVTTPAVNGTEVPATPTVVTTVPTTPTVIQNTTTVPTVTSVQNLSTTLPTPTTIPASLPTTIVTPTAGTVTIAPTAQQAPAITTGSVAVSSSPTGAYIFIDGVFYGTTPQSIYNVAAGTHIVRLTRSGDYDYEGTMYVVPGQFTSVYGTLPPDYIPPTTAPFVTTTQTPVPQTPTPAPPSGPLENPTVIASIIGVIAAGIGFAATVFSHIMKAKK